MNISQIYILVAIVILAVIAILVFFVNQDKREKRLTPLAGLAFGFTLAGLIFGENRWIGYGLMGIGVLLAVVDIFRNQNKAV